MAFAIGMTLIKPGISVITPNPKRPAAQDGIIFARGDTFSARQARAKPRRRNSSPLLYKNVPVLDSGARGSTTTFVERNIGDVLIAWENEAFLALKEFGADKLRSPFRRSAFLPSRRSLVVDKVRRQARHSRVVAQAYLEYLYTPEGQEIAAKNFYRPRFVRRSQRSTAKTLLR